MQNSHIVSGVRCLALLGAVGIIYAATLNITDKRFLITTAKADMTEAHEGQMAESQAVRVDVRDFAATMVQDHTNSYEQLTELASKYGVSIPKGIDSSKVRPIEQLARLKGSRFDRDFSADEVVAHRQELMAFKREAAHGNDADVKAYAGKMLPVLEKDLRLAEECARAKRP